MKNANLALLMEKIIALNVKLNMNLKKISKMIKNVMKNALSIIIMTKLEIIFVPRMIIALII